MTVEQQHLSVVVPSLGRDSARETIASILSSAEAASIAVQTICVWQGEEPPCNLPAGTSVIEVFPAGLSPARNRGLGVARAPIVAFVDEDELVDVDWVAGVLASFEHTPRPDAVFGAIGPLDDRGLPYCHVEGGSYRTFDDRATAPWLVGSAGNMAVRKDVLLAAGGFDPAYGAGSPARSAEESDLIVRLLEAGRTLAWSPQMVVYHPTKTAAERLASRFPYGFGMGKVVRRHRKPLLAARYLKASGEALGGAARRRDARRWREARETLRGFLSGAALKSPAPSPLGALERMPSAIADSLGQAPVSPLPICFRPDPHFLYGVGSDRILHLYVNPADSLKRSLADRDWIRANSKATGIPALHALEETADACWVLEELLAGRAPARRRVRQWLPDVARWLSEMAGTGGPRLHETDGWAERVDPLPGFCHGGIRPSLARALEVVGELPSRHEHGDFQPKNLLLQPRSLQPRIGVIDWEKARRHGIPGIDLLFLAVTARGRAPNPSAIAALASQRGPGWMTPDSHLRRVGIEPDAARAVLLVALADWTRAEAERVSALGFIQRSTPFRELLNRCAPLLT